MNTIKSDRSYYRSCKYANHVVTKIAKEIQAYFAPNTALTVHWDGKILHALTLKRKEDKLAVLVTGKGTIKLLGDRGCLVVS